jgi:hypothetical protein
MTVADSYLAQSLAPVDSKESFHAARSALRDLPRFPASPHYCRLLRFLANMLAATSAHAALYLLDEGLEVAAEVQDPSVRIELLIDRSRIEELIGDGQAARRDVSEVERTLAAFRDGIRKARLQAEGGA